MNTLCVCVCMCVELGEFLRDKEQQLEHSSEERGRRMEKQKKREERRAAVEERRRQQEEEEKERLEALVRRRERGGERERQMGEDSRDSMENRPKRWTWGGPPGGGEGHPKTPPSHAIGSALPHHPASAASPNQSRNVCDFLTPPSSDQPITKRLSNSSASLHSPDRVCGVSPRLASPSPQRPAYKGSPSRKTSNGPPEDKTPKTPTTERGPAPCLTDSSMRRLESPTTPTRSSSPRAQSKGLGTPKRVRSTKSRAQSPCSPGQYPPSPLRQRTPVTEGNQEARGHGTLERKSSKLDAPEKKTSKSSSRDLAAESPGTPTGRNVAGTMDAEEASRLLAERRRLARIQKEQEDKLRQEEERLRAEEEQRREQEAQERQAREAQQAEEERERWEEERKTREDEERRTKERRWKDMQDQLDREREEACLRAYRETERKRQERELLQIQEEQERLQRKKRIEEIMKRTRKSETDSLCPGVCEVNGGQAGHVRELDQDESPIITLGPLESKSCGGDELSDGVQSMDVSPVSRDELGSVQEFSPISEGLNSMSNTHTLEHLLDLTAQPETSLYPMLQAGSAAALGDLNKNLLIQDYNPASFTSSSPSSGQLLHSLSPGKLDI
ncbi:MAP7 domain-containing protein 2-like isoform X1 [Salvelinus alpinus]|uniref:MAP7 domain-containing protein 2-like isoform X1 n=1 Tax=Salvelinus alpinus TaxID=8036 RepID=UPI0039FCF2BD